MALVLDPELLGLFAPPKPDPASRPDQPPEQAIQHDTQQTCDFDGRVWTTRGRRSYRVAKPKQFTVITGRDSVGFSGKPSRRRWPPPPYPSVGWCLDTDAELGKLTGLAVTVPGGGGRNTRRSVVLASPIKLFDLEVGEFSVGPTPDGRMLITATRESLTVLRITAETAQGVGAALPSSLRSARIQIELQPWQPPWRDARISLASDCGPSARALHATGRLLFLPRGLHRANHRAPRTLPFHSAWLPPDFNARIRRGPSGLGHATASWHWMGEDKSAAIDVYDNVIGGGGLPVAQFQHEHFRHVAVVEPDAPVARFIVENRRLHCGYAIVGCGVGTDELTRVARGLSPARG